MANRTATEIMQGDDRVLRLAASVVARLRDEIDDNPLWQVLDSDSRYFAIKLAHEAAYRMGDAILRNDAELTNMRIERDHYRQVAQDTLAMRPLVYTISDKAAPSTISDSTEPKPG